MNEFYGGPNVFTFYSVRCTMENEQKVCFLQELNTSF